MTGGRGWFWRSVRRTYTYLSYFLACTFIRSRCSANTLSKGFDCVCESNSRIEIQSCYQDEILQVHWVVRWGLIYVV